MNDRLPSARGQRLRPLLVLALLLSCDASRGASSATRPPLPTRARVQSAGPMLAGEPQPQTVDMSAPLFRPIYPPEADLLADVTARFATPENAWPHRYGPCSGTSRTEVTVAARSKTPGWSVALPDKLEPAYLLALEDRVVVVGAPDRAGRQPVAIFDSTGAMRARLMGRAGAWAIDARADVLLGTMDDGMPAAWSLRDGNLRATMLMQLGGRGLDTLVVCDGTMLVGTRELPQRDRLLPNVTLEVVHIASYDSVTESDILEDAESAAAVIREHHDRLLAAAGPSGPVLALEAGGLAWTDWLLQPHAELRADVLPLGLSAHHDGSARAVVRTPEQIEFWQAQPGERRFTVPIGDPFADAATPAIHDDGMTVLASSSRIAAYWASGRVAWAFSREGPPGALIDAAGNTIVSHRELLLAYDRSGKATPLWTAPAPIVTAPIVARDRLYVCTSTNIFSLPA